MQKVVLGRTKLDVSVACLGAGGHSRLGQRHGATAEHSINVVRAALDLGINFIDTAPAYGTEEIVGTALKGKRDQVVVSTKGRANRPGSAMDTSTDLTTPAELIASIDKSLKLLATDYIDIFHMHGVRQNQYDHSVNVLVPVLMDLRKQGKIRFLGITEGFGIDREHAVMNRAIDDGHWDVLMLGYNLANPSAARTVLPKAIKNNIGTMCMYAVRGALNTRETARTLVADLIKSGEVDPKTVDANDPLGFLVANGEAASQTEAAYRFCRHTPGIGTVMTGTGSVEHLKQNAASIQGPPLKPETLKKLADIFGRVTSATGDLPETKRSA